jgi:hypothetical protein
MNASTFAASYVSGEGIDTGGDPTKAICAGCRTRLPRRVDAPGYSLNLKNTGRAAP